MKTAKKKIDLKDRMDLKTEVLEHYKEDDREEVLFSISFGDVEAFGIYVKEGEESAIALIEVGLEDAEHLIEMIHNGKLSAIHLREVAEDYAKEKI